MNKPKEDSFYEFPASDYANIYISADGSLGIEKLEYGKVLYMHLTSLQARELMRILVKHFDDA